MRHPFAGIIGKTAPLISRRQALATGAVVAGVAMTPASAFGDVEADPADYQAYLVVPKERRSFVAKAVKLGVTGPYVKGFPASEALKEQPGFLAWTTAAGAKTIADDAAVSAVHPITAADKSSPGKLPAATTSLVITLVPNGWRVKPAESTYLPADKLVAAWTTDEKLKELGAVFKAPKLSSVVYLGAKPTADFAAIIEIVLSHPQVMAVQAEGVLTTFAVGEEGATTKAVGEEGGPRPSTTALGEEGGATTQALGEEGGPRPSTRALGEEGGQPGVTTFALGEEGGGGGFTTQALGEEGGGK
jgi:hypothetical protein